MPFSCVGFLSQRASILPHRVTIFQVRGFFSARRLMFLDPRAFIAAC